MYITKTVLKYVSKINIIQSFFQAKQLNESLWKYFNLIY